MSKGVWVDEGAESVSRKRDARGRDRVEKERDGDATMEREGEI